MEREKEHRREMKCQACGKQTESLYEIYFSEDKTWLEVCSKCWEGKIQEDSK
jgi:ribosome-binding protein aMBF1 (putative translation factor)